LNIVLGGKTREEKGELAVETSGLRRLLFGNLNICGEQRGVNLY